MNKKIHNERYSAICAIAAAIAISGLYCFNIHFVQIAAILVMACIVDSLRR